MTPYMSDLETNFIPSSSLKAHRPGEVITPWQMAIRRERWLWSCWLSAWTWRFNALDICYFALQSWKAFPRVGCPFHGALDSHRLLRFWQDIFHSQIHQSSAYSSTHSWLCSSSYEDYMDCLHSMLPLLKAPSTALISRGDSNRRHTSRVLPPLRWCGFWAPRFRSGYTYSFVLRGTERSSETFTILNSLNLSPCPPGRQKSSDEDNDEECAVSTESAQCDIPREQECRWQKRRQRRDYSLLAVLRCIR